MNREELKEKYGKPHVPHEWRKTNLTTALITTFLGSGMSPKAPGTMGSLAAAFIAYPMAMFAVNLLGKRCDFEIECHYFILNINFFFLAAALFIFFAAIPFVNKAMKDSGTEDPGWIVIDEVSGIFMSLAFLPNSSIIEHPLFLVFAFGLFRFFDILKPLGIHKFEKFRGAWGVMADDLLGGFYAGILVWFATLFLKGII